MAMGTWNPQWEATEPLDGAPKHLNRRVGVTIGRPFHHHGLNATYVDINRETPFVGTDTYGNCYPIADIREQATAAFESTIADLNRVIDHLTAHRDRLVKDLESIADRDFVVDPPQS